MSYIAHNRRLTASLLAIASFAVAAPAFAQSVSTGDVLSARIAYSPASLSTKEGAAAMWAKIQHTAVTVCGGQPDLRLLDQRDAFAKCRRETMARAVGALNAPMVTAMANHKTAPVTLAARK
ncbi:MAG TPA: UrcA family protein [Caulobacteraceae bacterium]|nr:UrcA family protein [Caulobacteraceae bacterium]